MVDYLNIVPRQANLGYNDNSDSFGHYVSTINTPHDLPTHIIKEMNKWFE